MKVVSMEIPVELDPRDRRSLQAQLKDQLRALILTGRLKPGRMVPATRALAKQLNVSRNTVLIAYDQLIAEGYLETRKAIGTFVSELLPEEALRIKSQSEQAKEIRRRQAACQPLAFNGRAQQLVNPNRSSLICDFWVGRPDPDTFPVKTWRALLNKHVNIAGSGLTEYRDPAGLHGLRQAIADRLGPTRGMKVSPEQVIIVAGCQEALNVVSRLMIERDTPVVIENPCYQGAAFVFESYGAKLMPVPVDSNGIDTDQLPNQPARLVYVTPSHQYPVGATLSLKRRLNLLEWAWANGAYIVEDDYDNDFRYRGSPVTALKGLDKHGCVIYVGTFSKSLGTGLRIGYLVVPLELVKPAVTVKTLLSNGHAMLDQAVLAEFLETGKFDTHLRRIRQIYISRHDCLHEELNRHFGKVELSGTKGGMHFMWRLPDGFPPASEFERMARDVGVGLYCLKGGGAHEICNTPYGPSSIMLGYSSVPEPAIREGIKRVAQAVEAKRGQEEFV